jgi:hypothetical protein
MLNPFDDLNIDSTQIVTNSAFRTGNSQERLFFRGSIIRQSDDTCHGLGLRAQEDAQLVLAALGAGERHHSAFQRLFAKPKRQLDRFRLAVFRVMDPGSDQMVFLAGNDTAA